MVPLAAAFCLGIALQQALGLRPLPWTIAVTGALLLGLGAWWAGARRVLLPILVLGFACLGGQAMAQALLGDPAHHLRRLPEAYLLSPIPLEGWVVGPPDPRPAESRDTADPERTRFVVEITRLRLGDRWVAATGQARLTVIGEPPEAAYGDEIRGTFRLRRPRRFDNPGAFDYPAYLATQGITLEGWTREPVEVVEASRGSAVLRLVSGMRGLLLRRLDAAMPPEQAGLLKATVLGDRSGLSAEMNQAFLDSGTYHILAISGLNVSLLAGALFGLFRILRLSPRIAAIASAFLVTLYAALAGASASVVRATVMTDVYLLAVILNRRGEVLNSLALSALALLWWNPRFLFDVGFQLTYLATLGIVLILPRCEIRLAALPRALLWAL
ncbi:MAG: ComEC/Rec2 family competence protein, partial [Gemmatimonadales bacterium]